MITVAYIRVSTEKQAEHGNSLKDQQQMIAAYASTNGITINQWFQDVMSGGTEHRVDLQEILSLTRQGKIQRLLITKVDRLARDTMVGEQIYRELKNANVEIISIHEKFDNSLTGNLMRQMLLAFAEYEKGVIALRTHPSKRRLISEKATFWGGTPSFGYKTKGSNKTGLNGHGALEVNEDESRLVKRAYELSGSCSIREITRILNVEGYRNRAGNPLQPTTVMRILSYKDIYEGKRHINTSIALKENVTPNHPKISLT